MALAGSAIEQMVTFEKISKSNNDYRWLLLSGATDPPRDISISARRNRYISSTHAVLPKFYLGSH